MKKTVITIAAALVSFTTLVQAVPKDNTWYAGGKLGWAQFHDTGWYDSALNKYCSTYKGQQLGAGMFGGYQVSPHLGFEVGYDWLGYIPYKNCIAADCAFKAQGVQVTTKFDYPVTSSLDAYARLGGMVWNANASNNIVGYSTDTGVSPVFASGVEWAITRDIATRLEYQWINNIGNGNTVGVRPDNGMLSAGISYRFGQQESTLPVVTAASSPEDQHTQQFTLKSDVLFNFNKSVLTPDGQEALDHLYNQLASLNPKDDSIIILGFTDRIGSNTYNQILSEARAKTVVDYLISKGIPKFKISARGMGKANSVTSNTCDYVKSRIALINCLTPDRRVQIEIKGTKGIAIQPRT